MTDQVWIIIYVVVVGVCIPINIYNYFKYIKK